MKINSLTTKQKQKIFAEIAARTAANQKTLLLIFKQAGVPTQLEGVVTTEDLKTLYTIDERNFAHACNVLYPNITANADGAFNWQALVGTVLTAGGGLLNSGVFGGGTQQNGGSEAEKQAQQAQQAEAQRKAEEEKSNKTLLYVGIGAAVLVVLVVVILLVKKR